MRQRRIPQAPEEAALAERESLSRRWCKSALAALFSFSASALLPAAAVASALGGVSYSEIK